MLITPSKIKYSKEAIPSLKKELVFGNDLAVPRIKRVVINVGTGKISKEGEKVEEIYKTLETISGQKPVKVKAKKAISGFKVRKGMEIGVKVTLRGTMMWNFIDRLVNFSLPRTRDFQGIGLKSVDDNGNLNIGIKEQVIFPEVVAEKVKNIFSLQATIVTSAKNKKEGLALFRALGFPMKTSEQQQ
jgi:large subunit ribosomal protein L5